MIFLPIVERELRVAARQRGTYWTRVGAAMLALVLAGAVLGLAAFQRGFAANSGAELFAVLKWVGFGLVCLTGVFLTADCLSEEKREGTLGLLFLTDLRGYDVVLGKLLATSVRASYGLAAMFPVLGIALLLGGVTGRQFAQTLLVLSNTLFCSLAAGMLVSSLNRDTLKAMGGTLAVVIGFIGLLPLIDWWRADWDSTRFVAVFSPVSPAYSLITAGSTRGAPDFWMGLGLAHLVGWLCLAGASVVVPKVWQEKARVAAGDRRSRRRRREHGNEQQRTALRERLPLQWFAGQQLGPGRGLLVFLLSVMALCAVLGATFGQRDFAVYTYVGYLAQLLITLAFFFWLAVQAARLQVEGARSGLLELVLCTPATVEEVVRGQWRALWRAMLLPLLLIVVFQLLMVYLQLSELGGSGANIPEYYRWYQGISAIFSFVGLLTGILALGWFGLWMGLTSSKVTVAAFKTLGFALVLPSAVLYVLQMALLFLGVVGGFWPYWALPIVDGLAGVSIDVGFIVWSRRRLTRDFRAALAGATERARVRAGAVGMRGKPVPVAPPRVGTAP